MMKTPLIFIAFMCVFVVAHAADKTADKAPDLDLNISYYSKVMTIEGVNREATYNESMLRRAGHVWVARVVPSNVAHQHTDTAPANSSKAQKNENSAVHKHFNPVLIPRHISLDKGKANIEFIDTIEKLQVSIPVTEFNNVNFDGSWENSFYLLDPKILKTMPLSKQVSTVANAKWFEQEKNGIYQKVLWDEQKQIPLIVESGDRAGTFYRRVEVRLSPNLQKSLPWQNLKGYTRKEYADFLD
jgi:hypothetical protein